MHEVRISKKSIKAWTTSDESITLRIDDDDNSDDSVEDEDLDA